MKFTKHLTYSQYFTCAEHKYVLFFCEGLSAEEIELREIFESGFSKNFALLFLFDEYTDSVLKDSIAGLESDIDDSPRRIWWVESFSTGKIVIKNRPSLSITVQSKKLIGTFNNFSFKENFKFNTKGNSPFITIVDNNIQIDSPGNIELLLDQEAVSFASAVIRLDKESCGALNFWNVYNDSLIQPTSSYFTENNDRIDVHYFDKLYYNKNSEIEVHYFPYPNRGVMNSGDKGFFTKLKISNKKLKFNFLDEVGSSVTLNSELSAFIAFTEYKEGDIVFGPYYHFMPLGEAKLEYSAKNILVGNNGTETISRKDPNITINFEKNDQLKISQDLLIKSLNSLTSQPVIENATYHLDSEKSPLFKNDRTQSDYDFLEKGEITKPLALPIIPTLSFKENPDLVELEEVFKKVRLERIKKQQTKQKFLKITEPHITPQGFLKTGDTYDFIKPPKTSRKYKSIAETSFQFKILDSYGDIELSLRKDQVFFVLTPALFKKYIDTPNVKASLEALFSMNNDIDADLRFVVDLSTRYNSEKSYSHEKCIIVFKFTRGRFIDLIKDTRFWTNQGILNFELDSVKDAIDENIIGIKEEYFNTILNDENWNGIVILNIPIGNTIPPIFRGLASSQITDSEENEIVGNEKIKLKTPLNLKYAAFPINKTEVTGSTVSIVSTSFFGLIDYDILANLEDKKEVLKHFDNSTWRFILSRLKVRFANSSIVEFLSFSFLQIDKLFDDTVDFDPIRLTHEKNPNPTPSDKGIKNLIRLEGSYQRKSDNTSEFRFDATLNGRIKFKENDILKEINVTEIGFTYNSGNDEYRFDINAKVYFTNEIKDVGNLFSFELDGLDFQNVGLRFFGIDKLEIPSLKFDFSRIMVLPNLNFNGNGFLSSFPVRFSHFKNFRLPVIKSGLKFNFSDPEFDFFKIRFSKPKNDFDWPDWNPESFGNLFSFIFDIDLGNLGNLDALKALKGQLLIGWSIKGGFAIGFKLAGPSNKGLHLDLFGAVKLDIEEVNYGKFPPPATPADCTAYFLRLINARLTIFGLKLPGDNDKFNGLIISDPTSPRKIAWEISLLKKDSKLFVFGQGVGPQVFEATSTMEAIAVVEEKFKKDLTVIEECQITPKDLLYNPQRNYLIALRSILPEDWPVQLSVIFNDPDLYGIHLGFKGSFLTGFSLDILYKKLSENLGVYSMEWQLPNELRNHELGGAFIKLPNIGIDIFTNGDWKTDIGFPRNGNDWSRSGFIQLRTAPPFVGWFGFYMMASRMASLTLFKGYITDKYSKEKLQIIQAGFAMRVGIGFYFDKGILYVGASISVYGILEGAFAFERGDSGLSKLLPDHFAVLGRVGAIAELVGYVDFGIIKASVYISLRVEFGLLLVYLGRDIPNDAGVIIRRSGIQPVKLYVEGEVRVQVSIKIGCVKIRLSFGASVRFEFTIGGSGSSSLQHLFANKGSLYAPSLTLADAPVSIDRIGAIPMVYLPAFSRIIEKNAAGKNEEKLVLIHTFMIPFLGKGAKDNLIQFTDQNILKDQIILPFLQELIEKKPELANYENLRYFLLTGKIKTESQKEKRVEIRLPNYLPVFINGINKKDKTTISTILTNKRFGFGFDSTDVKPSASDPTDYSIISAYQNTDQSSLLVIPAPISSRIQVVDEKGTRLAGYDPSKPGENQEFDIEVDWLVADEKGNPAISKHVGKNTLTKEDKAFIETYYDSYKTQFLDRAKISAKEKDLVNDYDKRDDVMIPEFFKLAALLTIERFHQYVTNEYKRFDDANYKESAEINPFITITGKYGRDKLEFGYKYSYEVLKDGQMKPKPVDRKWESSEINKELENVAGQLNYFYNNGLRLPLKDKSTETKSIFEFVDQYNVLNLKDPIPTTDTSKISIKLAGQDITKDVFATEADKKNMWKFIEGFESDDFLQNLKKEFIRKNPADPIIEIIKPYKLVPVTLSIANSKQAIARNRGTADQGRFFELPAKLTKQSVSGKYSFKLNFAEYKKQDEEGQDITKELTSLLRCLNIEVKVKRHEVDGRCKVLEITSVYVDDLNLMYSLYNSGDTVSTIDFYKKQEKITDQSDPLLEVLQLNKVFATILKTNLSPRTSPPVFPASLLKSRKNVTGDKYWADSNDIDKTNFIRLLWEGLTTNNGGYYLIMDKEIEAFKNEKDEIVDTGTIIISFVAANQDQMPGYFNSFKLPYDESIFKALDDKTHYLYLDKLKSGSKDIWEYHPLIPAHTFGFELRRDRSINSSSNYDNYLPLEFDLFELGDKRKRIMPAKLNADSVLPLMPTSELNDKKEPIEDKYIYNHLAPLVIQRKDEGIENYDRYCAIGKSYQLNVNVRDIFGFRTIESNKYIASQTYKHLYFDKIIPVDSWPLVNFSYWISQGSTASNLTFDLCCSHNILEIQDLAGIPKLEKGQFRYGFGKPISDSEHLSLIQNAIKDLFDNLNTIIAQLTDKNLSVIVRDYAGSPRDLKTEFRDLLKDRIKANLIFILKNGKMPEAKDAGAITLDPVVIKPALSDDILKTELNVSVRLTRGSHMIDQASGKIKYRIDSNEADLTADNVWDYKSVYDSLSGIKPLNFKDPLKSTLNDLNVAVRNATALKTPKGISNYCLGIASEEAENKQTGLKSGKMIYLVNERKLAEIKILDVNAKNEFIREKCYYGIKPYSNKLWSGNYRPSYEGAPSDSLNFTNIDLDKSLKIVLAKVDELLYANKIPFEINGKDSGKSKELKALYEKLVSSKKLVVDKKLKSLIGFVDSENDSTPIKDPLVNEFRDLILDELNKFYSYDGLISTRIDPASLRILDSSKKEGKHRMSINLKTDKPYNLVSSKIGYSKKFGMMLDEWYILFDQRESSNSEKSTPESENINFNFSTEITHLEYDISLPSMDSEIEHSVWIQLLKPITLPGDNFNVKEWPFIKREFPDKPVIQEHSAIQMYKDDGTDLEEWKIEKAGKWKYRMTIKDVYDKRTDKVNLEFDIKKSAFQKIKATDKDPNFEGFIAYWSASILDFSNFKQDKFIEDFSIELNKKMPSISKNILDEVKPGFNIIGQEQKDKTWIWVPFGVVGLNPNNISVKGNKDNTIITIEISQFDIFEPKPELRIVSVLPSIKVFRNPEIPNLKFRYETESVKPVTAASPQIRYYIPITLKGLFEDMVFKPIPNDLPFKATAKYLINTATKDQFPKFVKTLPTIPVKQIECENSKPSATDDLFVGYANGFGAFSLTVYNHKDSADEFAPPVFYVDTIVKK